jgi:hypothetical protein
MKALQSIFDAVVGVATDMFADVLGPRQTELDISSCELSISEYLPHAEFRLMSQAGNNERPWFSTVIPWRLDTDAYDPKSVMCFFAGFCCF